MEDKTVFLFGVQSNLNYEHMVVELALLLAFVIVHSLYQMIVVDVNTTRRVIFKEIS